jgi:hypothetical protein
MATAVMDVFDVELPVVVTAVSLPNPQNHPATTVTGQRARVSEFAYLEGLKLNALAQKNREIADLLRHYVTGYANSSLVVTSTATMPIDPATMWRVPARTSPFAHLDLLSSPVEGLYFDPDDIVEG